MRIKSGIGEFMLFNKIQAYVSRNIWFDYKIYPRN